jgi:hypothetical protein
MPHVSLPVSTYRNLPQAATAHPFEAPRRHRLTAVAHRTNDVVVVARRNRRLRRHGAAPGVEAFDHAMAGYPMFQLGHFMNKSMNDPQANAETRGRLQQPIST